MTTLAMIALRTSVVLAAALLGYVACRRQSAALRHFILAVGVCAGLLVAPLGPVLPTWHVAAPGSWLPGSLRGASTAVAADPETTTGHMRAGRVPAPVPAQEPDPVPGRGTGLAARVLQAATPGALVTLVWLIGLLAVIARLGVGLAGLARWSARTTPVADIRWRLLQDAVARELRVTRPVTLVAGDVPVICTWGVLRPRITLPAYAVGWSDERARAVLCHELAHVQRGDWAVQIAGELLRAVFWFNPLTWIVCRRLRDEAEHACDDVVLRAGVRDHAYAEHLLDIARGGHGRAIVLASAMPMARSSTLEGRIAAMLNVSLDRRALAPRTRVAALVVLVTIACGVAALRVSAQSGPAALHGAVYDSSGGVLPGVELVLENEQGVKWTTPTDGTGRFEFAPVGAGKYVLEAVIPGFRTLRQEVVLERANDWNKVITLQVGSLQETITVTARRPRNPVSPAADPGGSGRVRVGGNIKAPTKVVNVNPIYPESMRGAALEGVVKLDVVIGTDGWVTSVRVVSEQVHPAFAKAAADAVRQWKFTPTLLNGAPVEVAMTASITFSLSD